ncbi:MAG: hypothetical protein ACM30G_03335 [Micromonosporaceae bacterium]
MRTTTRSSLLGILAVALAFTILATATGSSEAAVIGGTDYVLFAKKNIKMEDGPVNITGNIAVNNPTGFIRIGAHNVITGSATANEIRFGSFSQVTGTCEYNSSTGPVDCGNIINPAGVPIVTPWPPPSPLGDVSVPSCVNTEPDKTVPAGVSLALGPGCYGDVRVRDGATLNLGAGTYNFKTLRLESQSITSGGGATVNVQGAVVTEPGVTINDVTIRTAATVGVVMTIGVHAELTTVLLYAPYAKIHLFTAGEYTGTEVVAKAIVVQPLTILPPTAPAPLTCIEVTKNCEDATEPGGAIHFTGFVRNCGTEALDDVTVTDDAGTANVNDDVVVLGPVSLTPNQSQAFSGSYVPASSPSTDTVTASGVGATTQAKVDDKASATCEVPPLAIAGEGCTPGYWKQQQHFDSWAPTGLSPTYTAGSLFSSLAGACPALASKTLLQSLQGGGGPAFCDKVRILIRAAVAAFLNAQHPDIDYPLTVQQILNDVNAAIASGNAKQVTDLASSLDDDNNGICPLN